jgi:hypothetical protein
MKRFAILSIVLIIVMLPVLYYCAQVQHSRTARDRVERLLRDKSSTLSRSVAIRVGNYDSAEIDGAYAQLIWRSALVDGVLKVGQERYWFRIIDRNGVMKIEAIVKLK